MAVKEKNPIDRMFEISERCFRIAEDAIKDHSLSKREIKKWIDLGSKIMDETEKAMNNYG